MDYDDMSFAYYPKVLYTNEDDDTRVSALLGPDGNPLIIRRARPRIGFDLRPAQQKEPKP